MQSAWLLGSGAGLLAAMVSIVGNVWRGDQHTFSILPGFITGLTVVLLLGFGARRAMRRCPEDRRGVGARAAGGAAL